MLYYKEATIKVAGEDLLLTYLSDENHHNIATLYGKVRKPTSSFNIMHNIIDIVDADGKLIGLFLGCINEQEAEKDISKTA